MGEVEWYRAVHKHQHQGAESGEWCEVPWSALCQSEHWMADEDGSWWCAGRVCYGSDHPTHARAMAALERHVRSGACDPNRDLPYTGHVTEEAPDD